VHTAGFIHHYRIGITTMQSKWKQILGKLHLPRLFCFFFEQYYTHVFGLKISSTTFKPATLNCLVQKL